ncbi:hypothetical protein FHU38_001944 [Saccharomonospora amisosensis]|uniref:DUF2637 domain-containing protein n=1 Tax=Saccharomonospora amisosensis TaxID=1128677 RepID=A0A7X5UP54_9PSEU|nr:hypothetical protein [Saccharomonospora amisosensis]NIJ11600.1 hypothetical protein [Saccharomonospora amisosensis]
MTTTTNTTTNTTTGTGTGTGRNNADGAGGGVNGHPVRWVRSEDASSRWGQAWVPEPGQGADDASIWGGEVPDPAGLAAAVGRAHRTVELQTDPALRQAKSPGDLAADLAQERTHRELQRGYEDAVFRVELEEQRRGLEHHKRLSQRAREAREAAADAAQRRDHLLDPTTALVRLDRARRWAPIVALLPAVFAMIAGAVNVGVELTRLNPHTVVINWVIEPLLTVPIVAILIAQIAGAVPAVAEAKTALTNPYVRLEVALFTAAAGLNVGLHYIPTRDGNTSGGGVGSVVWLIVPVGLAVSMHLVPALLNDLTARFVAAKNTLAHPWPDPVLPTPDDLHGKNPDEAAGKSPGEDAADNVRENPSGDGRKANVLAGPRKTSLAEHRARLADLVAAGEIDPATAAVNAVAKRLGCRWDRARALLAEITTNSHREGQR